MTEALHRPLSADVADRFTHASQERAKALLGDEPAPEVVLPTSDLDRAREYVENSLKCLGNEPYTVGLTLMKLGITGLRQNPSRCPIASYINGLARGFSNTIATGRRVYVYTGSPNLLVVQDPEAVVEFIEEFDDGLHEYLVAPE